MNIFYIGKKIQWFFKKRFRIYNKKTYAGRQVQSIERANTIIANKLSQNTPFCVLRFGFAECLFIESQLGKERSRRKRWEHTIYMRDCFQTFEECERYVNMVLNDCGKADIMAYWPELEMEDFIIEKYAPQAIPLRARYLEPIYLEPSMVRHSWTQALEGKKVLIISPFVEDIKRQYLRISKVFPQNNPWPVMELKTLKSVWYPGKEFENWFEALDFLFDSAIKIDFDVVLLSCGPFGFNLAARFKNVGKQAIHIGGALQMMFGIMGKRWENHQEYSRYVNEYWIRPSKDEKPDFAEELDGSCYW